MAKYILVDGLHNCVPAQFVQQIHQYSLESCRNHFTLLASPTYPYCQVLSCPAMQNASKLLRAYGLPVIDSSHYSALNDLRLLHVR